MRALLFTVWKVCDFLIFCYRYNPLDTLKFFLYMIINTNAKQTNLVSLFSVKRAPSVTFNCATSTRHHSTQCNALHSRQMTLQFPLRCNAKSPTGKLNNFQTVSCWPNVAPIRTKGTRTYNQLPSSLRFVNITYIMCRLHMCFEC